MITIKKAELGEQIPKTIHYHWYGKPLPVKYFHNIMQAHFLSPAFKIMLFTNNPEKIFDTAERNLENFPDSIRKFIRVISLDDLLNDAEKYFSADMMKHIRQICFEETTGLINYAALSDLTRLISLWLYGGAYLDTDLVPTKEFILPEQKREEGFITVPSINDCILSVKHHPVLLKAIVEIINNYVKMRKVPAIHATSFFSPSHLVPGYSFDDDLAKKYRRNRISILDLKRHPNKLIHSGYYSRQNLTVTLSGPTVLEQARFDYRLETNTPLERLTVQKKTPTPRISKERARLGYSEEVYNFGETYAFCDSNWVGDERPDALKGIKTTPSVTTRRMSI